MSKPVRIAIVGLGWWGKKMLSVLRSVPEEIVVVRAVEPNLNSVKEMCQRDDLPVSENFSDALSDPNVEAVVLATPHSLHEQQIEAAAAAGKHVFCEKPLALTKEGASKAVKHCHQAGLQLGMGHERRFEPPVARLLEMADKGLLGRIQQIEANFSHDKFRGLDQDNWRLQSHEAPAGGMTATGIHLLDLSVRLLGPAKSVHCVCENLSSNLPQGDTVSAFVQFQGGGTSYVSASLANPFYSRFAVFGSKGWIDIRDKAHVEAPDGWVVTSAMEGEPILVEEIPQAEPVKDNLVAFSRAIRGKSGYPITGDQLVNNISLLEAIFESSRSGRIESVK